MARFVINNATNYQNKHLRTFVTRVARFLVQEKLVKRENFKDVMVVTVRPMKGKKVFRRKEFPGFKVIRFSVGRRKNLTKPQLAAHIAWHLGYYGGVLRQVRHGNAWFEPYHRKNAEIYGWANELPLEEKPKRYAILGPGRAALKAEGCQKKVAEWDAKLRRAKTALKKWQQRLKYYQRKQVTWPR